MTDPVFALEPDVPRNVRLARWLLFRLLSGLREGSLTVREGAQTFHFGDPAAALRAEARVCTPERRRSALAKAACRASACSRARRASRSSAARRSAHSRAARAGTRAPSARSWSKRAT